MTDLRAAAQQALEALEAIDEDPHGTHSFPALSNDAITALRAALAQQEPVAWGLQNDEGQVFDCIAPGSRIELSEYNVPLYTHPPRRETEQEPVACFIGAKGSAFDLPTTKRAYTYAEQPGNVAASKLGRSLETAKRCSAGDSIDAGLVLLKALQSEGFGVFQLGAEYTHPPRREWVGLTDDEISALFPSSLRSDYKPYSFARAIEAALKERNT